MVIAEEVRAGVRGLFVESVVADGLHVTKESPWLDGAVADLIARWNGREAELVQLPEILAYRELTRRFGVDAIPAVENLATRLLTKGKFPRINSLVDAANVASLRNLIPVGLFDLARIAGAVTLDIARPGDAIVPLGKAKSEAVPVGFPVLRDQEKIISIVGVRDSAHTMIVPSTAAVLAFSWGIESVPRERVSATLSHCIELFSAGGVRA